MFSYFPPQLDRLDSDNERVGFMDSLTYALLYIKPSVVTADWMLSTIVTTLVRWIVHGATADCCTALVTAAQTLIRTTVTGIWDC